MSSNEREAPVIVIVSFGSTMEKGLDNLADFDRMVTERFPDHDIRWAFTAASITNDLKRSGVETLFDRQVPIKRLNEVYDDLRREGKTKVALQCLLIMPGLKMRQALAYRSDRLNIKIGYPLLFHPKNVRRTADALSSAFDDQDTAVVLCAHGNGRYPAYNGPFLQMEDYVREHYENVYMATVEGPPGSSAAIEAVKASGASRVTFIPLMLVEGVHMADDVMGNDPESWESRIGLPATSATGLASHPEVMEIFLENIEHLLSQF